MNHIFDIEHAKKYGVEEAIIISNLQFWIMKNRANKKHFYEGRTWTYNSIKAFAELFPYWSDRQIERILKSLEKQGVIISGNYNKSAYDRTKWYAFSDETIFLNPKIHLPKTGNGKTENGEPIPDINTDINSDVKAVLKSSNNDTTQKNLESNKFNIVSQAKRDIQIPENIQSVIDLLNKKAKSAYTLRNKQTQKLIQSILKNGFTDEDMKTVIEKKSLEWGNDAKMKKYIRPITLFGNKFEQYLEEPWADGRKPPEKYDPEKHIKFPRWDALPPEVQYRWNDEEYYTTGRTEYVQGQGKKIFWTDDYQDLVKWEAERKRKSDLYHAEVARKQAEYIANGGSEYDDEYPL